MKKVINKNKIFYIVISGIIAIIVVVTAIKFVFDFVIKEEEKVITKTELDSLELYGYTLDDMDTETYKGYFEELKGILNEEEVDEEAYASGLIKLFVTDFYTLSNKITSSDIGGLEFIHADLIENFKLNAGDTIYNHVKTNIYGDRKQELPIVKSVTISEVVENSYTYKKTDYEGYKVTATWEYEKDMGYETSGTFYLIKDNDKLYVVEKPEG